VCLGEAECSASLQARDREATAHLGWADEADADGRAQNLTVLEDGRYLLLESVHWYGEADARTSSCASSGTGGIERGASGLGSQAEAEAHYRGPMSRGGARGLKATGK